MSFEDEQIPPLKAWDKFEDLCLALFRAEWQDSTAQKNGRSGQPQAGVDVFGTNHTQGGGFWGVQCKVKQRNHGSKLTQTEIDGELAKADTFQPVLAHWIVATTAANDAAMQEYVRILSAQRVAQQRCPVSVFFWESIEALLHRHQVVAKRFYPAHFAQISPPFKPLRLPAITPSAYFSDPANHLAALRQQLETSGSSALLAAATVQGMGGVGKTQLALKYSLEYQNEYAGVWWLQAETASLLEQDCVLFCHKQDIPLAPGEAAGAAMCQWLAGQQARWLLVYDNAEDAQMVRAALPTVGHHVLITSRKRSGWAGMKKLELDVWQEDDALPFLRARLAGVPDASDAQLRLLTRALDGLPLALEQACAYIIRHQVSVAAYCQRIQAHEHEQRLLARTDSEFCPRSVLATLSLAFENLSEAAKELLGLCAWLAAEPIPEYLFTENLLTENPVDWETEREETRVAALSPALQVQAADDFAWRETVAELENHALCQTRLERVTDHVGNGAEQVRCLNFHRLTQAAVRASVHGQQASDRALVLVWAAFPSRQNSPQYPPAWPRCRTLMPHVQSLQGAYQDGCHQAECYASLLTELAVYLAYGPAMRQQAEGLCRQSMLIKQSTLGNEHPATLASMCNLAIILWQTGDLLAARKLQETAQEICSRVFGEEHPDTLTAINNLAVMLRKIGDLPGARALHERVLAILRRVLGEEHAVTLQSINNMAVTLAEMGDFHGARLLLEQVLAIRCRLQGEEHPDTLLAHNNLAVTLSDMGDLHAAQSMMEQAYFRRCRILGEEHPDTLESKQNLAIIVINAAQNI
jgi:hypothetical protein